MRCLRKDCEGNLQPICDRCEYPGWISVKDRLPTSEYKFVICLINKRPVLCNVTDADFSFTINNVSFYWPTQKWVKDDYYGEVTHWMQLPEPPKE